MLKQFYISILIIFVPNSPQCECLSIASKDSKRVPRNGFSVSKTESSHKEPNLTHTVVYFHVLIQTVSHNYAKMKRPITW